MCRIVGYWSFGQHRYDSSILERMRDSQTHGGPDDAGIFIDAESGVGLGHRRLSVIDLSSGGHQPMCWKHFTITYNGEVYNYQEIRLELRELGYAFESESDTEVILKAFEQWGLDCVKKFIGMFAFAIWDSKEKKLYLCRDRLGVKPLYFSIRDKLLLFSSELRGISTFPGFSSEINQESIQYYLRYGYIPSPGSVFKDVEKLPPGYWKIFSADGTIRDHCYWSMESLFETIPDQQPKTDESLFLEETEALLTDACKLRMIADVPVGIFLSGGIDSTLITTLLQRSAGTKLKTFTIGFEDREYDESLYARNIAAYLGTEHHEYICTPADFIGAVEAIPEQFDEPFGDSSCIPAFIVAKNTRGAVTVALSADGGDELFSGYTKYYYASEQYRKLRRIPASVRGLMADTLQNSIFNNSIQWINQLSGSPVKYLDSRLYKFAEALGAESEKDFLAAASANSRNQSLRELGVFSGIPYTVTGVKKKKNYLYSLFTLLDAKAYLEGDILTKVDRTSMHTALEAREPLLDHRLAEWMLKMPDEYKIRNGQTKWALRSILEKYIPRELYNRPKQGFAIPLNLWLKTHFAPQLLEMGDDVYFAEKFQLNSGALKKMITRYIEGNSDKNYHLVWFLLMLHLWQKKWNS